MNAPLHQIALSISEPVDFSVIQRITSMTAAIDLCIRAAGKEPKEVYIDLGIDKGHWSKMLSGLSYFPHEKFLQLMDLCGNDIPLQWLAWRRGKGLHLLESEQQRLMRSKDERIAELEKKLEWTQELVRQR